MTTNIVVLGADSVGKRSVVSRFIGKDAAKHLESSETAEILEYSKKHKNEDICIKIVKSTVILASMMHFRIFNECNGVILVLDSGNRDSADIVDEWLPIAKSYAPSVCPFILLANKADNKEKCFTEEGLNNYVRERLLFDWFWTVGLSNFGDYDHRRGNLTKQATLEETIGQILRHHSQFRTRQLLKDNDLYFNIRHQPLMSSSSIEVHSIALHDLVLCREESNTSLDADIGWKFYAGRITREQSEDILRSKPIHSFLIRSSENNSQLRVVVKRALVSSPSQSTPDSIISYANIPIKIDDGIYKVGKTELREVNYTTIGKILVDLELNVALGVQFKKYVTPYSIEYMECK